MASKFGLILAIYFIFLSLLLGTDLIVVQAIYSSMDSITTMVSYNISKSGSINEDLKSYVKEKIGAELYCLKGDEEKIYKDGETFEYYLKKNYKPISSLTTLSLTIKRFAVIKIYN